MAVITHADDFLIHHPTVFICFLLTVSLSLSMEVC